jgi:D-arabinose 1-dehydrogenase-like Zn-dependent alcohol dehydrogenase
MRAWVVSGSPGLPERLVAEERARPVPGPDEVLVEVTACGVCRTNLYLADHDLTPHRARVVPGHEVVGRVVERGERARPFETGDRLGIYGFGASAHLTAQLAVAQGLEVHVLTRTAAAVDDLARGALVGAAVLTPTG